MKKIISTSEAPGAIGPYSQAVRSGRFLFCSGQIPLDPKSGKIITGDTAMQTRRVLDNIASILRTEGMTFDSIIKTTIFLTNLGDVDASGVSAGVRAAFASRLHASVEYSLTRARLTAPDSDNLAYLLVFAPSAVRPGTERIHDVATSIETDVPETSTRVVVLYKVSSAFAHAAPAGSQIPSLDARFDVQVRQSLPFMDFSSAKWEMLVAVRNFFREAAADQSIYDELLVVRPPKRIVGGLTLKF